MQQGSTKSKKGLVMRSNRSIPMHKGYSLGCKLKTLRKQLLENPSFEQGVIPDDGRCKDKFDFTRINSAIPRGLSTGIEMQNS